jgi:KDEL-tailed cysteine endopeptidase
MMKTTLALATVTACCAANFHPREKYEVLFADWLTEHDVQIANGKEFVQRLQYFADNHDIIEGHNAAQTSYKLAHNEYSHLTLAEFHERFQLGLKTPTLRKNKELATAPHTAPTSGANPSSIDWVSKGAVTPVKNQGSCGSCWSFSATGALEGAYQIKYNNLQSFSEQELVSCDTVDGGCNGGWMDDAFTFAKNNGGLCTESDYPYTSGSNGKDGSCNPHSSCDNAKVAPVSFTDVTPGSVSALESAVAKQPVSIAIQANQPAFQFYSEGVLTGKCGQRLDHGVLAVGYGVYTDNTPYWKVKNSWGPTWGMDGYILIEKSDADLCGVLDAASYPNL